MRRTSGGGEGAGPGWSLTVGAVTWKSQHVHSLCLSCVLTRPLERRTPAEACARDLVSASFRLWISQQGYRLQPPRAIGGAGKAFRVLCGPPSRAVEMVATRGAHPGPPFILKASQEPLPRARHGFGLRVQKKMKLTRDLPLQSGHSSAGDKARKLQSDNAH